MKMMGALVVLAWVGGVRGQPTWCTDPTHSDFATFFYHYRSKSDDVKTQQMTQVVKEYKELYGDTLTMKLCNGTMSYYNYVTILSNYSLEVYENGVFVTIINPGAPGDYDLMGIALNLYILCPCNISHECVGNEFEASSGNCSGCPSGNCTAWSWAAPTPPSNEDDDDNGDIVWIVVGSVGGAVVLAGVGVWVHQKSKPQGKNLDETRFTQVSYLAF